MIYSTSGGFIQSLKDYDKKKAKAEQWKQRYQDLYYERYEKVRSPLDYDIVKYKKNKKGEMEAIRQIKTRGSYNEQVISNIHEQIERDMENALNEYSKLKVEMENTLDDLKKIDEPLKGILIKRYMEHKKLKEVCQTLDVILDESGLYKFIMKELEKYYN